MDTKSIKVGFVYIGNLPDRKIDHSKVERRVVAMGDTDKVGERAFVEYAVVLKVGDSKTRSTFSYGQCSLAEFAAWAEREVI